MARGPNVIQRLRKLQARDGWLTDKGLSELSRESGTPVHELFGVASFYPEFNLCEPPRVKIRVCTALPCQMKGSEPMIRQLEKKTAGHKDVVVERAPCLGACEFAPVAIIDGKIQTCNGTTRTKQNIIDTVEKTVAGTGQPVNYFPRGINGPFRTDPYASESEHFGTVKKVLANNLHTHVEPNDKYPTVIKEIETANLRGMGGSGAAAARKWTQVYDGKGDEKFVVANADESEPGTLKDREILRNLPHLVVEGMTIAGLTLGATQGYIYLRHEYEEQHEALEHAIKRAYAAGAMGENIMGSGKTFNLEVFTSPGGYVLGEASALLEALEGKRGQPRNGFADLGNAGLPSYNGLWGKPTLVNNVETYLYVPVIMNKGSAWFKAQGFPDSGSEGLKFASVCGDVLKPGVFEISMGMPFKDLIEMAGGVKGGWDNFKAFAPSGPSFGFRPITEIDAKIDFSKGPAPTIGSGAVIVLDNSRCMVDAALNFTRFFRNESCGKCVPCRVGSHQLVNLIRNVRGYESQTTHDVARARSAVETIDRLNDVLYKGSICGLGKVVPVPLASVREFWPEEFEMHIKNGTCGAATCPIVKRTTT